MGWNPTGPDRGVLVVVFLLQVFATLASPGSNALRLVGGSDPSTGRLEIFSEHGWGTVCDDAWDHADALVACRQLGFTAVESSLYSLPVAAGDSVPILLDEVGCAGDEGRLAECPHRGWGHHNCAHLEDVAIRCGYQAVQGDPLPIRLSGGGSTLSGRLEVYADGAWGTVCDDNWDLADALVACRELGYNRVASYLLPATAGLAGPIHLYFVGCAGDESRLAQCVRRGGDWGTRYCDHGEDVSLACEHRVDTMSLRLADGRNPNEGRLEVFHDGQWGTVCDDYWDEADAAVACRQMGLGGPSPLLAASSASGSHGVPAGTGPITLDDVACGGWEARLGDCAHLQPGTHNCQHHEDVRMACAGGEAEGGHSSYEFTAPTGYHLRLVDGLSHYEGRLELDVLGMAVGICDRPWTPQDAAVACRQLGFGVPIRQVSDGTFGMNWAGYYWVSNVSCTGHESTLLDCTSGIPALETFCNYGGLDVGVACTGPFVGSEHDIQDAAVRLEGGSTEAEGRVEIYVGGRWSTVCGDEWDDIDADVVCRQLGYWTVLNPYHYVDGLPPATGYILLDNVRCEGDEMSIMGCRHNGLYTHNCGHWQDAIIECDPYEGGYDWSFSGGKLFAVIAAMSFVGGLGLFLLKRRTQLEKQRQLVVVPAGEEVPPPPPAGVGPPACPRPYPVQQPAGAQPQPQPPPPPALGMPPVGLPDPRPLPPSYLTATEGADGVHRLPVYLPSPVPTAGGLPAVRGMPPQQMQPPNHLQSHPISSISSTPPSHPHPY